MNKTRLCALYLAVLTAFVAGCDTKSEADLLAGAQAQLDKQQVTAAVIQLKDVLSKNPNSAPARLLLGKALLQGGDAAGALAELGKAEDLQAPEEQTAPEMARALLLSGDTAKLLAQYRDKSLKDPAAQADLKTSVAAAQAAQGELGTARATVQAALQLQPGHRDATLMLARIDASEGAVDEALRHLDGLLSKDAGHIGAGLLKGEILLRARQDSNAALAALRQVRTAHPDSVAALTAVINVLLQQRKPAEAKAEWDALNKLAPKHPDTQLLQAQFALDTGDFKAVHEITERLLSRSPNNVRTLLLGAAANHNLRQYTLAEGLLGRALKVAPDHLPTLQLLAQTYLRTDQPDKALQVLGPALQGDQADATSLRLAGEAHLRNGDNKRAEQFFQAAAKRAPQDASTRVALARAQFARGDADAAVGQLEALAKGDQGTQAEFEMVSMRLQQNDYRGALAAVDALEKKLPDQALPMALRGRVLVLQGNLPAAAAQYERALAKDPNHFPAVAGLAALDHVAGKPELARKRFEGLIKAQPKNVRARLALVELETRAGTSGVKVAALLRDAIKADPSQPQPHLALIENLLAAADGQAAQIAAQEAAAALPNSADILEALGRTQMATSDFQRATSSFKRLASLQPRQALPLVRLSEAQVALKDFAAADGSLRQALEVEPNSLLALRGQGRLAVANDRLPQALQIARGIQARMPKDPFGYALEGEVGALAKDWPLAAAAYGAALQRSQLSEHAVKRHQSLRMTGKPADAQRMAADWLAAHPKDAQFHFYLGDVLSAARDWPAAEAEYRAVLALRPQHASSMNNIAWLMATQRKPGAVSMAERAVALLPDRAPYLDTLAFALEAEQQFGKAAEAQRRALELDPKDSALRWRLAQLLIKSGDKSAARKELETLAGLGARFGGQAEVATLLKTLN